VSRSADIQASKLALRREVTARLRSLTEPCRAAASVQACALLQKQPLWTQAHSVLLFAPLPGELHVWPLLQEALAAGKAAALPRFDPAAKRYAPCQILDAADIRVGHFGIREPRNPGSPVLQFDLILVPGLAFDLHGHRLGRGKGYYDQLLSGLQGPTCGVAFDEQVLPDVPAEPHDARLNYLLTPTRWLRAEIL
jgi:5-formyltetrahydrofolate cyclo-ligase